MQSIFLSLHFDEVDRDLVDTVQTLVESLGLAVLRGDALGGVAVSPAVQKRINSADACIGLATPDQPGRNGSALTFPWVQGELTMARMLGKPCIAIVEKTVALVGPFSENEKIRYDPARPLPAIKKLALTIALWRQEAGRLMKALVLPEAVAMTLAKNLGRAECEYRYYDDKGKVGSWRPATIVPQAGGPIMYLDGAADDYLVEVRLKIGAQQWTSTAIAPFTHVKLAKVRA